ncbi:hypothetical protein C5167_048760 [Papaver somniferum]|uniref:AP2/ERF domain-containing protein n=1 Tax=Papaver somniferum TaxID=3469 RepID=A0A4Y7KLR4_PAPSO|nr:hypothetical protein C5167_048760 [Papaver somniferum]
MATFPFKMQNLDRRRSPPSRQVSQAQLARQQQQRATCFPRKHSRHQRMSQTGRCSLGISLAVYRVYLGGYDKEDKASKAYDLAALKFCGPATRINFPLCVYHKELEEMKNMNRHEIIASIRRKSSTFSRGTSGRSSGGYDIAAIKYLGERALTNFDISKYDVKNKSESSTSNGGDLGKRPSPQNISSVAAIESVVVPDLAIEISEHPSNQFSTIIWSNRSDELTQITDKPNSSVRSMRNQNLSSKGSPKSSSFVSQSDQWKGIAERISSSSVAMLGLSDDSNDGFWGDYYY